ncbi:hypothetical protein [Micromonospora sp. NBC_01813]|uniref:hypothetical protein n=1 Tax=Micromonospora sp. NBC_01813 TaxID=2975988 RepID=UPI002DD7C029|nr:hypothetical protein [Micromonospora sp. NBC_01813]WSA11528.1 hypothetical protein OG958_12520 [Micromonospora sp. NBC_01813]
MSKRPAKLLTIAVNGEEPIDYWAPVTHFNASSGWNTGDFEVEVAGVLVRYSNCGSTSGHMRGERRAYDGPVFIDGYRRIVTMDFRYVDGPIIEVLHQRNA